MSFSPVSLTSSRIGVYMMVQDVPNDRAESATASRVSRVLADVVARRESGVIVPDETVIAAHPELMPELGKQLRILARIEAAMRDAGSGSSDHVANDAEVDSDSAPIPPTVAASLPGYEVYGEINRGSQGVIYVATQRSTGRKVAIKVMREGPFAGPKDRLRFEREVQILGQLHHSSIVTIFDSGTAAGNSYYVMDYVEGKPLDAHVADHKLSMREMLDLFAKVCDAVNGAHLRGVIHRDLKPGNILVDPQGEPHILDFGLARFAEAQAEYRSMTLTGQFMGSLPWAAPEQAAALPGQIDTRTDVYALGVILYQLLTGRFPYEIEGSMRDVLDRILQADPIRPGSIHGNIDNDLETIVLKCLAKDRDRRYQTAGEIAREIRRYLAGEAIEAKRDSTLYVLKRSLFRHKAAVAVAAAFTLLVLASLVTLSLMYRRQGDLLTQVQQHAEDLTRQLYVSHIRGAEHAVRNGQYVAARGLLEACPPDLRQWEWDYLDKAVGPRPRFTLSGQGTPCFTPDSRYIIAAGKGAHANALTVWDAADGSIVRRFVTELGEIGSNALSPDGKQAIAGALDGWLELWDLENGRRLWKRRPHQDRIDGLDFSPDGKRIACVSWDRTLTVLDAETGTEQLRIGSLDERRRGIQFSPDGARLAIGGRVGAGHAVVWDVATGENVFSLIGEDGATPCAVFSPDGRWILSGWTVKGKSDQAARLWDAETKQVLRTFHGHTNELSSVAFSLGATRIATGAIDRTVRLWDTASGRQLAVMVGHRQNVLWLSFSPDGQRLASASEDAMLVWDADIVQDVMTLRGHHRPVFGVAFSPDGRQLASAGGDSTVRLWNLASGQVVRVWRGLGERFWRVAFDPKGTRIAAVGYGRLVMVWNVATGERIHRLAGHAHPIRCLAFSPDGTRLATGGTDSTVRLWDMRTGRTIHVLDGREDAAVWHLAFLRDGSQLAAFVGNGTIKLWHVDTGQEEGPPDLALRGFTSAALASDGQRVVSGGNDGTIQIANLITGDVLHTVHAHNAAILSVAFDPEDRRVFSGSDDHTVKVWNPATGEELLTLDGHEGWIDCVAVSRDGRTLASASEDGTIRVWETRPPPGAFRSRLLVERANNNVDARFKELTYLHEVIEALRSDETLDEPTRKVALEIAATRGENAGKLGYDSLEALRDPDRKDEVYRAALEKAEALCRLEPDSPNYPVVLAIARYRLGEYSKALATLGHAETLYTQVHGTSEPGDAWPVGRIAFMAMTHYQLGDRDAAEQALARMQVLMQDARWSRNPYLQDFSREAEQLISGLPVTSRPTETSNPSASP